MTSFRHSTPSDLTVNPMEQVERPTPWLAYLPTLQHTHLFVVSWTLRLLLLDHDPKTRLRMTRVVRCFIALPGCTAVASRDHALCGHALYSHVRPGTRYSTVHRSSQSLLVL